MVTTNICFLINNKTCRILKTKNNKLWDLTKLNKCMQKFPVCAFKNFHINSFQKGLLTPNNVRPINPKC